MIELIYSIFEGAGNASFSSELGPTSRKTACNMQCAVKTYKNDLIFFVLPLNMVPVLTKRFASPAKPPVMEISFT